MAKYSNTFLICLMCVVSASAVQNELVTTKNGCIRGKSYEKWISWTEVPYAQPPIGANRFEPPKPVQNWDGVKEPTSSSTMCLQWHHFIFNGSRLLGQEDCLYLNIHRSKEPSKFEKLPVVFYLHGGAFQCGSGSLTKVQFLMSKPIIFVTVNYRLGPLGFLSTQDENIPGNMGLKDQTMALKWIHDNIEAFGGDRNKITITGFSAGGASVHLHYLSKLSKGLFQSGISHSGSALNPWVFTEKSLEKTKILALNVGCPIETTTIITECLKQKDGRDIVASVEIFQPWLYNPLTPFGVVVEPIVSDTAFITQTPEDIIRSGSFYQVPWMVSAAQDEGYCPAGEFLQNQSYLIDLNANWVKIAPFILHMNDTIPYEDQNHVMNEIRNEYLGDQEITETTLPSVVDIITDHMYLVGIQRAVKLQTRHSSAPVYFYYYRYDGEYGVENILSLRTDIKSGVAHGDDIFLIYGTAKRDLYPYNEEELKVQKVLLDFYYNYLTSGKLFLAGVEFQEAKVNDPESNHNNFRYLEFINYNNVSIKTDDDIANEIFWKQYPFV